MAGPTTSVKNAMLDNAFPSGSASLSLHSGDPGETGLNELSGGPPAYARKTVTLTAASAGTKTYSTGVVTFDVAAGSTAAYVGVWISGTFKGGFKLPSSVFYTAQGTYQLQPITIRIP